MSTVGGKGSEEDEIPLILCAAVHHPDSSVRGRIRNAVAEWLSRAGPRFSRERISSFLRSRRGTPLEPFELNEQDLELAEILTQYAFSNIGGQTRFRVVSRETIGTDGGVMLTDNLHGYYIERYVHGFRTKTPTDFGFVAPAEMPGSEDFQKHRLALGAVCRLEETGLSITLSGVNWSAETQLAMWDVTSRLQRNSHVSALTIPFTQLGLRVEIESDAVRIRTGGPEALLRMSAHMMQRSTLVLSSEQAGPRTRAFIRLEPPGEDVLVLPVAVTCTSRSMPEWMRLPDAAPIPLTLEDRLAIARWFRPHDNWMDTNFLEELV